MKNKDLYAFVVVETHFLSLISCFMFKDLVVLN
jgi:hypothetical protein